MNVNNLPLPTLLEELISQGRWRLPENLSGLLHVTGFQNVDRLSFLGIEAMQRETEAGKRIATNNEIASIYGLASSSATDMSAIDPTYLDVDKAILIAISYDEEAIYLDYRDSKPEPTVVACVWIDNQYARWRTVAPNFKQFALDLGL